MKSDNEIIRNELSKVGVAVDDIYELVNTKKKYTSAIPTLVKLLSKVNLDNSKEGIIRALSVKEAKGVAGQALLQVYQETSKEKQMLLWAIGNTFETIASDKELDEILKIVNDPENGISRQMFVLSLRNFELSKVETTLIKLLDDDEVCAHALEALGKLKSIKAIPKINNLLSHKKALVKKEAQKALAKINT